MQSDFAAYEGLVYATNYLRIGLATAGGGAYFQRTDAGRIEAEWRPGLLTIVPPNLSGEGRCAPVNMVGLAVDLHRWPGAQARPCPDQLVSLAGMLHRDEAIASVLLALRHAAELHGCSTLFFEHGVELVLGRIAALSGAPAPRRPHKLDRARLDRVFELVEARLAGDLSVAQMAAVANYEASGFTRAFKQATGSTPFAYLTARRMERAALLLEHGEPVTRAALTVGYANASKFAAAFQRRMGVTPRQWRALRPIGKFPID
ncbi:helix-turn-helix transcriptional regulator [Sphingomonas sp. DT-204]|uniref:helix-turn-helix transcriptional regulator n=1 Tax=Sphingomonas sp. DT-204 TaxID=3396166 RepID=UPI003F1B750E